MQNLEKDFIVNVPKERRIWVVGAIYGDRDRLAILHKNILESFKQGDVVIYLGNFMGYGPNVGGVLDELFAFRKILFDKMGANPEDVIMLRGQQEEMWKKLLTLQFARKPENIFAWMMNHGVAASIATYGATVEDGEVAMRRGSVGISRWTAELRTLQNDSFGHTDILNSLKHAAITSDGRLLFVSWTIDPSLPLAAQGDTLWWGSSVPLQEKKPYGKFSLVIRGESNPNNYGVHSHPYFLHINSAGGRGGPLFCVLLEDEVPTKAIEL